MILITGTTGFIGSYVLQSAVSLYNKDNVIALTSAPTDLCRYILHNNYSYDKDIFIKNRYEVDVLIHIGAFIPKIRSDANDINNNNSNILNTQYLLSTHLPNLKKIIFISTIDVYKYGRMLTEESELEPVSLYGMSKLYCEYMIKSYAEQHNIVYNILRIGHTYGIGEERYKKVIPLMMKNILENKRIDIYGKGLSERAFINVNDVSQAIVNSIKLDTCNIINIAGKEPVSMLELANILDGISDGGNTYNYLYNDMPAEHITFNVAKMDELLGINQKLLKTGLEEEFNKIKSSYENNI